MTLLILSGFAPTFGNGLSVFLARKTLFQFRESAEIINEIGYILISWIISCYATTTVGRPISFMDSRKLQNLNQI